MESASGENRLIPYTGNAPFGPFGIDRDETLAEFPSFKQQHEHDEDDEREGRREIADELQYRASSIERYRYREPSATG